MLETIECAHALCNCTITAEMQTQAYCSDACRNAEEGGIETETCACGHPPCDVQ